MDIGLRIPIHLNVAASLCNSGVGQGDTPHLYDDDEIGNHEFEIMEAPSNPSFFNLVLGEAGAGLILHFSLNRFD